VRIVPIASEIHPDVVGTLPIGRANQLLDVSRRRDALLHTPNSMGPGSINENVKDVPVRYDWPGNIRELQNVIERSVVLSRGSVLELAMPEISAGQIAAGPRADLGSVAERERILQALKDANGVVAGPTGAARQLGLKRTTLQARMKKLGITRDYQ
jgi:transcriptional regulator with GAF, ATPase, and Fis domain